jgi:hypothetical protein
MNTPIRRGLKAVLISGVAACISGLLFVIFVLLIEFRLNMRELLLMGMMALAVLPLFYLISCIVITPLLLLLHYSGFLGLFYACKTTSRAIIISFSLGVVYWIGIMLSFAFFAQVRDASQIAYILGAGAGCSCAMCYLRHVNHKLAEQQVAASARDNVLV